MWSPQILIRSKSYTQKQHINILRVLKPLTYSDCHEKSNCCSHLSNTERLWNDIRSNKNDTDSPFFDNNITSRVLCDNNSAFIPVCFNRLFVVNWTERTKNYVCVNSQCNFGSDSGSNSYSFTMNIIYEHEKYRYYTTLTVLVLLHLSLVFDVISDSGLNSCQSSNPGLNMAVPELCLQLIPALCHLTLSLSTVSSVAQTNKRSFHWFV
jgi:hypothetical protein